MAHVRFTIGMDRNGRPRDEAEAALKPVQELLVREGINVLSTIKSIYRLICTTDKDTFERLFGVGLLQDNQKVPNIHRGGNITLNNWVASGPLVIPKSLRDTGVTSVEIDQQRAVLRFP